MSYTPKVLAEHWIGEKGLDSFLVRFKTVEARVGEGEHNTHCFAFEVLQPVADEDGKLLWETRGARSSSEMTEDIENAELHISGTIKWDGCAHVDFGRGGYIHFCGPSEPRKMGEALHKVWELAKPLFGELAYYDERD